MRIGIGVSTGTQVVCAALVVEEDDGSRSVEYRTISTDSEVNTDTGDLVSSAIELMASLAPAPPGVGAHGSERRVPDVVAVTHRTQEQATSVRSALARTRWTAVLVPEAAAAHAFLDDAGLIARYGAVVIVDVGATGTTASVVDTGSGVLLAADRTEHFSGDVVDRLVKDLAQGSPTAARAVRDDIRDDRGVGSARYRAVKEHLSAHDSAEVRGPMGSSSIDRAEFDHAVRPYATNTALFTERTAAQAVSTPEAVILIGGGAKVPVVRAEFDTLLSMAVLAPADPDTILATGAAHLALNGHTGGFPMAGPGAGSSARSIGRFSGALVGALLVGGIVVAYGVQTLAPNDRSSVSPAGSAATSAASENDLPIADGDGSLVDAGTRTSARPAPATGSPAGPSPSDSAGSQPAVTTRPSVTPSLHPAPDLPLIPWPASPRTSPEISATSPSTPRPIAPGPTSPDPTGPVTTGPDPTSPVTTSPVTTTPANPSPGGSTDLPPTEGPGESTTPRPATGGSTELSPPPVPAITVPTTDVNDTPSPGLSPPTSVWAPPPTVQEQAEPTPRSEARTTAAPPPPQS